MTGLVLDATARANLRTFVARGTRLEPAGVAHLQRREGVLAVRLRARPGDGLLASGQAVGLRLLPAPEGVDLDVTVRLRALLAALGDEAADPPAALQLEPLGPAARHGEWIGLAAPRDGWEPVGEGTYEALPGDLAEPLAVLGLGVPGMPWRGFRAGRWRRVTTPRGHLLVRD